MASLLGNTGWKNPSATGETYNDWGNPTYAYASDNDRTTSEATNDEQDYYNFTLGVPSGATISSIQVKIEGLSYFGFGGVDVSLSWDGGSNYTSEQNAGLGSEDTTVTLPGLWGRAWTGSELNNANFRVKISNENGVYDADVDHIQVKVFYLDTAGFTRVVYDTFTEPTSDQTLTDHTPDVGTGYVKFDEVGGTMSLQVLEGSDELAEETLGLAKGAHYYEETDPGEDDYTLLLKVNLWRAGADDPIWLYGRIDYEDPTDPACYALMFQNDGDVELWERDTDGNWSQLGVTESATFTPSAGDTLEFEIVGTALKGYVNGAEVISRTDATLDEGGQMGFGYGNNDSTVGHDGEDHRCDNFEVWTKNFVYIEVSDAVTISEDVTVSVLGDSDIDVHDDVTVAESVTATVGAPGPSVYDSVTVSEDVTVAVQEAASAAVSIYDSATVADVPTVSVSSAEVDVHDDVTVTENVAVSLTSHISVFDSISVTDVPTVSISAPEIDVHDDVTVAENVAVSLISHTGVFDSISVTDVPTVSLSTIEINVSDSVSIQDVPTITVRSGFVPRLTILGAG